MEPLPKINLLEEQEGPVLTEKMRETLLSMDADQLNFVMGLLEKIGIEGISMEELLDIRQEIRKIIRRKKVVGVISQEIGKKPSVDLGKNAEVILLHEEPEVSKSPEQEVEAANRPIEKRPHLELIK